MRIVIFPLLAALSLVLSAAAGCQTDLTDNLDGKQCDSKGECVAGYTCDEVKNLCVRSGSLPADGGPVICSEGETVCGGECVVVGDDADNCGGCGATCTAPPNGRGVCLTGDCSFACEPGFSPCATMCTHLAIDFENCGACGKICPVPANGSATCIDGQCGIECNPPSQECDGKCVDVSSDPARCGSCTNVCAAA